MLKLPLAVAAVITAVLIILATESANAQTVPPELPLAVTCWNQHSKIWRVAYLQSIKQGGTATYVSADGRLSGTVNAKGVVEPPPDLPAAVDCYGKTSDQLRAMGRVIEAQRTR